MDASQQYRFLLSRFAEMADVFEELGNLGMVSVPNAEEMQTFSKAIIGSAEQMRQFVRLLSNFRVVALSERD